MILTQIKKDADNMLGQDTKDAVITVPAYFNNMQRQATRDAGELAKLNVLRVLNEPTSAALAYGIDQKDTKDDMNTLIIDLGGGTFDNTILVRDGDFLEVKATNGDTHLGGADFDNNVVEFCRQQFIRDNDMDIIKDAKAMRKLKTQVEKIKCVLSTANSAEINVDALHEGEDFSVVLSRQKFE